MEDFVDYYSVLGVSSAATQAEIRKAYNCSSTTFLGGGPIDKIKQELVDQAFHELSDVRRRRRFERIRMRKMCHVAAASDNDKSGPSASNGKVSHAGDGDTIPGAKTTAAVPTWSLKRTPSALNLNTQPFRVNMVGDPGELGQDIFSTCPMTGKRVWFGQNEPQQTPSPEKSMTERIGIATNVEDPASAGVVKKVEMRSDGTRVTCITKDGKKIYFLHEMNPS